MPLELCRARGTFFPCVSFFRSEKDQKRARLKQKQRTTGANNQKHFMLFLLYTVIESVYCLALILYNYEAGIKYNSGAARARVPTRRRFESIRDVSLEISDVTVQLTRLVRFS